MFSEYVTKLDFPSLWLRLEFFVVFGISGTEGLKITKVLLFEFDSDVETMLLIVEIKDEGVIFFLNWSDVVLRAFISSTLDLGVILILDVLIFSIIGMFVKI